MKRAFDICMAVLGLALTAPLLAMISFLIKLDSRGPVIFRQVRVGQGFRPFAIQKFRTMAVDAPGTGLPLTVGQDARITKVGRILRKFKLDELPQLFNVLVGDMSFVGPRPEVPRYVERLRSEFSEVLTVRPGITDLASLRYIDEATLLAYSSFCCFNRSWRYGSSGVLSGRIASLPYKLVNSSSVCRISSLVKMISGYPS